MDYQQLVQSADCLRHFRMEDSSDAAIDSGPLATDGLHSGSAPTTGRFGQGRSLDTGQVLLAGSLTLDGLDEVTLALWVRWRRINNWQTGFRSQSRNHQLIFRNTTGELGMYLNFPLDGFNGCGYFPTDWGEGEWRHLAVTCDRAASLTRYYVDGAEVGTVNREFLSSSAGELRVGNEPVGSTLSQPIGSAMDDALIFGRVLTSSEVNELAAGPEPTNLSPPSLLTAPVVGESVPRDPGVWDSQGNGEPVLATHLQTRSDPLSPWQDVPGSEEESFLLPNALAGQSVRVVSFATNDGGASSFSSGDSALVAAAHYRSVSAASVRAGGAASGSVHLSIAPAAGAVFSNVGGLS